VPVVKPRQDRGALAIVLHTHMPYVEGFGTWPFGEEWLWEAMASCYLPLLELLRGVSVNSLATRILTDLHLTDTGPATVTEQVPETDDADRFIEELSAAELRQVLAELEKQGGGHS